MRGKVAGQDFRGNFPVNVTWYCFFCVCVFLFFVFLAFFSGLNHPHSDMDGKSSSPCLS